MRVVGMGSERGVAAAEAGALDGNGDGAGASTSTLYAGTSSSCWIRFWDGDGISENLTRVNTVDQQ